MIREKNKKWLFLLPIMAAALIITASFGLMLESSADTEIQLIVDGKNITTDVTPIIRNDRMLVPVRVVSEELGAIVTWDNDARSVLVEKGDRSVLLRIDKNLIAYSLNGNNSYNFSDTAPIIINDRTLVPVRLISNALGVGVRWDDKSRIVTVNSSETSDIEPFFDMKIASVNSGQTITGKIGLKADLPSPLPVGTSEIRYLILDAETGSGFIIARGNVLDSTYEWLPSFRDSGNKILVSALYNSSGTFLAGDAIPIQVNIIPTVELSGISENQTISGTVNLSANINFSGAYVKYEIKNIDNGKNFTTTEQDPLGTYSWAPPAEYNGNITIKVTAFDQNNQAYPGRELSAVVQVSRNLNLTGVKSGQTIDKPVNLNVSQNFNVSETEYFVRDVNSGDVQSLYKVSYGGYSWFPGPEAVGNKELYAQVKDTGGMVYTSNIVPVNVPGTPKLILQGTGPDQVITTANPAKLKVKSNVTVIGVRYVMTNAKTGVQKIIADTSDPAQEIVYTPDAADGGTWKIKAEASYIDGNLITEEVTVNVYTGTVYPAKPVIEKSQFLGLASNMAVEDWKQSGMSAALQTAQAILETGWGQSVPVDKYKGQFSYNLFGIKGTGTAGTVVSNTWEEYNGVSYRVDANFRAYNNISESWKDHNALLLTKERYEPYREVMHDSSLGAWALRRAGYATDSMYPVKLMNLINAYNLEELDRVAI
ncbi:MAG: stalk domain-containing protein [Eubacteriales bacterium]|nr:stalk domain-containing protein [Eubacteriales bacterium]MDD3199869.1 stalk domain-containing protein [Eubacteriales bacterium]MDD4121320.1 stalk domain-containing protein [Eubacteriales bacterium]MDD4630099.1 stalk domain-containing protein [Eubacteriales bacterium]